MAFDTYETSVDSGEPAELYTFRRGAEQYHYTSADHDIIYSGTTYTAALLRRSSIDVSAEMQRNNIKIDTARDFEITDLFRIAPPADVITVTIQRMHEIDGNPVTIWSGRILNAEWTQEGAQLVAEPVYTSLKRVGLRKIYQKACPHVLYSGECGLNINTWRVLATITAINGLTLTIPVAAGYADSYFAGGFVEYLPSGIGVYERRFIRSQTGSAVRITAPMLGLLVNSAVRLYPGCDHTTSTCSTKFSNLPNFGGFPFIPTKNPFGGSPIY